MERFKQSIFKINKDMKYSALLGNPVEHSISPYLFGILTNGIKDGYAHVKILTKNEKRLAKYIDDLGELGFSGINITLPYKVTAIKLVDKLDDTVKKIGALNTIVYRGGKKIGYNTDAAGAMRAMELKLRGILPRDFVLVIGAGGAARAVVYEIYKKSKNILIVNRDLEQAEKLSDDISSKDKKIIYVKLNDNNLIKYISKADFIINTTPVGMYPDNDGEIVAQKIYNKLGSLKNKYFFDAIFNPYETKFLSNAKQSGATVCSGLYMMIFQAVEALKLWIGEDYSKIDADEIAGELRKYCK